MQPSFSEEWSTAHTGLHSPYAPSFLSPPPCGICPHHSGRLLSACPGRHRAAASTTAPILQFDSVDQSGSPALPSSQAVGLRSLADVLLSFNAAAPQGPVRAASCSVLASSHTGLLPECARPTHRCSGHVFAEDVQMCPLARSLSGTQNRLSNCPFCPSTRTAR